KLLEELDEEEFKKLSEDQNLNTENTSLNDIKELGMTIMPIILTLLFIEMASEQLGTPKLEIPLEEEISNQNNHVAKRLVYTLIYSDLKLSGFVDKLNKIVKETIGKSFYRMVLYYRLLYYYSFTNLTNKQRGEIEKIMAGIRIKQSGQPEYKKSGIIAEFKKGVRARKSETEDE
ncbi:MAG: hypothetical protein AB1564_09820, partial [Chloroflexota bacterium]